MDFSPKSAEAILQVVDNCLKSNEPPSGKLSHLWRTLLYFHAQASANYVHQIAGNKVIVGPFKDMLLTNEAIASYRAPGLLGCYEHELHPIFEKITAGNYTHILNIGCSAGYYAVGLARRMTHALIEAFDIDPKARTNCAALAQANAVQDRVRISSEFRGEDFAAYADKKPLVLMDIEGAETDLLDPIKYPALKNMDVVVELHDVIDPTISQAVCNRFVPSHHIELIQNRNHLPDISYFASAGMNLNFVDQFLLGWEGRGGATPWGVFWAIN